MKIYKTTVLMLGTLAFFTACATPPRLLEPSPFTQNISNISCGTLSLRLIQLQENNESLYSTQERLVKNDEGAVAGWIIGGMLIIPIPFLAEYVSINGDGETARAIQKNKGEIDAIKRELISGRCN